MDKLRKWIVLSLMLFVTVSAYASDDAVSRGMKLYEKHHYAEAADTILAGIASLDPGKRASAYLGLGMTYLKSSQLYSDLHRISVAIYRDYFKRLSAGRSKAGSRYLNFYYGDSLLEAGMYREAITRFNKFLAEKRVSPHFKAVAKIRLGLCHYLKGERQKALTLWKSIRESDPGITTELAAAYVRAGVANGNPAVKCDKALAVAGNSGKTPSVRLIKNALRVYAKTGSVDKGLALLGRGDMKAFSYEEVVGKNKMIDFYEISLLGDMADFYARAGMAYLEKAAEDSGVAGLADYYLGDVYSLSGNFEKASAANAAAIGSPQLPARYKDRVRVRMALDRYRKGRKSEAVREWDGTLQSSPSDPDLAAEVLFSCIMAGAECTAAAQKAEAEAGEGRKYYALDFALGNYYLLKGSYAKAVSRMEAGRDKGNKNKIESNDPRMLANLAEAYYRTKQFSEALEIFFEMSKQFPAVRQIQAALQGVYSMEEKSSGDVKIF